MLHHVEVIIEVVQTLNERDEHIEPPCHSEDLTASLEDYVCGLIANFFQTTISNAPIAIIKASEIHNYKCREF